MEPVMRKPIGITVSTGEGGSADILYAICDDGSIWRRYMALYQETKWDRVEDIPQDDNEGETE
jgi:hypothetical protein